MLKGSKLRDARAKSGSPGLSEIPKISHPHLGSALKHRAELPLKRSSSPDEDVEEKEDDGRGGAEGYVRQMPLEKQKVLSFHMWSLFRNYLQLAAGVTVNALSSVATAALPPLGVSSAERQSLRGGSGSAPTPLFTARRPMRHRCSQRHGCRWPSLGAGTKPSSENNGSTKRRSRSEGRVQGGGQRR